jgi:hypothetical protein
MVGDGFSCQERQNCRVQCCEIFHLNLVLRSLTYMLSGAFFLLHNSKTLDLHLGGDQIESRHLGWGISWFCSFPAGKWLDSTRKGKKVKISLCWMNEVPHHEDVWWNEGITPPFLNLALDGGEWLASRPGRFTPRGQSHQYPLVDSTNKHWHRASILYRLF